MNVIERWAKCECCEAPATTSEPTDVIGLPLLLCQRCANAGCTVLTARHEAEQA